MRLTENESNVVLVSNVLSLSLCFSYDVHQPYISSNKRHNNSYFLVFFLVLWKSSAFKYNLNLPKAFKLRMYFHLYNFFNWIHYILLFFLIYLNFCRKVSKWHNSVHKKNKGFNCFGFFCSYFICSGFSTFSNRFLSSLSQLKIATAEMEYTLFVCGFVKSEIIKLP